MESPGTFVSRMWGIEVELPAYARGQLFFRSIYFDPLFGMAKRQFEVIADYLEIAEGHRERIIYPKRAVSVAVPIPRSG